MCVYHDDNNNIYIIIWMRMYISLWYIIILALVVVYEYADNNNNNDSRNTWNTRSVTTTAHNKQKMYVRCNSRHRWNWIGWTSADERHAAAAAATRIRSGEKTILDMGLAHTALYAHASYTIHFKHIYTCVYEFRGSIEQVLPHTQCASHACMYSVPSAEYTFTAAAGTFVSSLRADIPHMHLYIYIRRRARTSEQCVRCCVRTK